MAVLYLHCCASVPLVVASRAYSLHAVRGLLAAVVVLLVEHELEGVWAAVIVVCGLTSCGSQSLEHRLRSCGSGA